MLDPVCCIQQSGLWSVPPGSTFYPPPTPFPQLWGCPDPISITIAPTIPPTISPKPASQPANYTKHRSQGSNILMRYLFGAFPWFPLRLVCLFSWELRFQASRFCLKSWSFNPLKMETTIIYVVFAICLHKCVWAIAFKTFQLFHGCGSSHGFEQTIWHKTILWAC